MASITVGTKATDVGKPSSRTISKETIGLYDQLIERGYTPEEAAKSVGLDRPLDIKKDANSFGFDPASLYAPKETTASQKIVEEARTSAEKARSDIASARDTLSAIDRIVEEGKNSRYPAMGGGVLNGLVRLLDRNLEPIGLDVGAGQQTDWQKLDTARVNEIGKYSAAWKGAISDYENRLFASASVGPDKTPEFNRGALAAAIGRASLATLAQSMLDEINASRQNLPPLLPSSITTQQYNRAIDWLIQTGKLPNIKENADKTSADYVSQAKAWGDFASDVQNSPLIREAIFRAMAASQIGSNDLNDPSISKSLLQNNVITSEESPTANTPVVGNINKIMQDATEQDAAAVSANANVTDVVKENANVEAASKVNAAQATQTPVSSTYEDVGSFVSSIQNALAAGKDVPTEFTIAGRSITLNRFATPEEAATFIDNLKANGQPYPKLVVIGGKLRRVN